MIKRNIFEVSDDEKMRILGLHENATKNKYLIFEQSGDKEILRQLNEYCNQIEKDYQNELLKTMDIAFDASNEQGSQRQLSLTIGNQKMNDFQFLGTSGNFDIYQVFTGKINIPSDKTLGDFMEQILQNPNFKMLIEKYPQLKSYITNTKLQTFINQSFKVSIALGGYSEKQINKIKNSSPNSDTDKINLGEWHEIMQSRGTEQSSTWYNFGDEIGYVAFDAGIMGLSPGFDFTVNLIGDDGKKDNPKFAPIVINLPAGEPFEYDSPELTDAGDLSVNNFIKQVNDTIVSYPKYKEFLESQKEIPVTAYSSIDGKSEEIVPKKPNGCGGGTRAEYNLCLSQKRADKIVEMLKTGTGLTKFVGKGMGETDKFAPGMKWPKVTDKSKTLPNRRFEVALPEYVQFFKQ